MHGECLGWPQHRISKFLEGVRLATRSEICVLPRLCHDRCREHRVRTRRQGAGARLTRHFHHECRGRDVRARARGRGRHREVDGLVGRGGAGPGAWLARPVVKTGRERTQPRPCRFGRSLRGRSRRCAPDACRAAAVRTRSCLAPRANCRSSGRSPSGGRSRARCPTPAQRPVAVADRGRRRAVARSVVVERARIRAAPANRYQRLVFAGAARRGCRHALGTRGRLRF